MGATREISQAEMWSTNLALVLTR